MSRDARVDNDATGLTMPVGHGAESPVKAEPDPEGPWFTVGRDGRHTRSASRASANVPDHGLGGRVPLSEEVRASVRQAEEGMTPAERLLTSTTGTTTTKPQSNHEKRKKTAKTYEHEQT